MDRWFRWLLIALLIVVTQRAMPAASASESAAFNGAVQGYRDGLWSWAESAFDDFVRSFPESDRLQEVILYQAQCRHQMRRYSDAIALLSAHEAGAGRWRDEYRYWIARSHAESGNNEVAADEFATFAKTFPNSNRLLDSAVGEAAARTRLGQTPRVVEIMTDPNGAFQKALPSASGTNDLVGHGYLLLGEAQLQMKDYSGLESTLDRLAPLNSGGIAGWRRIHLRCRALVETSRLAEAAGSAEQLVSVSASLRDPGLQAESAALQAGILEKLGEIDAAIASYERNLGTNAPAGVEHQRFALLKIAELHLARGRTSEAVRTLERYLNQQPGSEASDAALLALGELELKEYLKAVSTNRTAAPAQSNLLVQAIGRFDRLLSSHSNSPLTGKALLNKGWCFWEREQFAESADMFSRAVAALAPSEDRAVARFKWADSLFRQNQFEAASTNYALLTETYAGMPVIRPLLEQALYQSVRAALAATNMDAGREAMRKILEWYPNGFAGPRALLLTGEGYLQQTNPVSAREVFDAFARNYPDDPLQAQVRLAVARSYEQEGNWAAAATNYQAWREAFPGSPDLPYALFCHALAESKAGRETNALDLLNSLLTKFPTNDLAVWAQFEIGNHFYRSGDYPEANRNYQLVFQNTNRPSSELMYQARMMAGRSAVAHANFAGAIVHFTNLTANPRCPPGLRAQATIAYADAVMNRDPENRPANLQEAITILRTIAPTNELAGLAQARIGDCSLQLAVSDPQWYAAASNAYHQVINFPNVTQSTRYLARIGLANVAELQARQKTGEEQAALYQIALDHCAQVIYTMTSDEREKPDPLLLREAGIRAGRCAKALNQWEQALKLYTNLLAWLPSMRTTWENEIILVQRNLK